MSSTFEALTKGLTLPSAHGYELVDWGASLGCFGVRGQQRGRGAVTINTVTREIYAGLTTWDRRPLHKAKFRGRGWKQAMVDAAVAWLEKNCGPYKPASSPDLAKVFKLSTPGYRLEDQGSNRLSVIGPRGVVTVNFATREFYVVQGRPLPRLPGLRRSFRGRGWKQEMVDAATTWLEGNR